MKINFKCAFALSFLLSSFSYALHAQELEIGHYATSKAKCNAPKKDGDDRGRAWMQPNNTLMLNGEYASKKGNSYVFENVEPENPDIPAHVKIAPDGKSFQYEKATYVYCDPIPKSGPEKLPIKVGVYVRQKVDCLNPVMANIQGYYGDTLSYGHGSCAIQNVQQAGASFRVKSDCRDPDATKGDEMEQLFKVKGKTAFRVSNIENGKETSSESYRWCGPSMPALND